MANPLLSGIRVLDLTRLLPGPFCSFYLAQLGAEVIKLEEPQGGDYARMLAPELFTLLNRGKQSVTLDLRQPEAVAILKKMAAQADVLIESFRPGVMDKLGCGYPGLKLLNPRLVYAALTGYGQTGPYKDRAGHDMNYCGYAGLLDQTGAADGAPVLSNFQSADLAGGALTCALGILAAVIGARASGQGTMVDVGMLDGTLALQTLSLATIRTLGEGRARGNDMLSGGLANYSIYACADGKHVAMAALEPKFFLNFCNAVGRLDLAAMPLVPGPAGATLRTALSELFKTRSRDEWELLLADRDCCVSGIYTPQEALDNPQVKARGLIRMEDGKPLSDLPIKFSDALGAGSGDCPALGADTYNVLAELGLDEAALAALSASGAI
ncbi:Crotonobetainyl-CoA:carnitine CoA-transferase CaiB [Collimonas sp. OK242]|jgi:crotonobetainyl-CoA:carnitine CoA-transferase CaiB-like acyl-CoA transferase|uniref:CaiB/BaiF CoA transferase family protein n=1 Tax=Collimonas sp. OK242 TaxID=1798195 RepID=UPI00089CD1FE|nr:CaiB/BaiF CoA-transferase family protein [Collimonas sp. OK242]SDY76601.1 Crotonobetainyl-CoA:carnitine CoA-transferase CaiB [Collimonas sp. OK242]